MIFDNQTTEIEMLYGFALFYRWFVDCFVTNQKFRSFYRVVVRKFFWSFYAVAAVNHLFTSIYAGKFFGEILVEGLTIVVAFLFIMPPKDRESLEEGIEIKLPNIRKSWNKLKEKVSNSKDLKEDLYLD